MRRQKYYFFRDLDNESNLDNGKTHHSAGIVESVHCELNKQNYSGKDFVVLYFSPFEGIFKREWRSLDEIELFEVSEHEYRYIIIEYLKLIND